MTYSEWRSYGLLSRLSIVLRCGGPSDSTIRTNEQVTQSQIQLANQQMQVAQQAESTYEKQLAQSQALEAPLITQQTALASGDPNATLQASMPVVSQLSAGFNASKEQIMNNIPAGPARDAALANLEVQKNTGIAGTEAQMVQNAPGVLAGLGSQQNAFSLQELGAALSGFSGGGSSLAGAGTTNYNTGQLQNMQSQAFWSPILGLASIAGNVATGGLSGGFSSIFNTKPSISGGMPSGYSQPSVAGMVPWLNPH